MEKKLKQNLVFILKVSELSFDLNHSLVLWSDSPSSSEFQAIKSKDRRSSTYDFNTPHLPLHPPTSFPNPPLTQRLRINTQINQFSQSLFLIESTALVVEGNDELA
jgi:hypothetical protein